MNQVHMIGLTFCAMGVGGLLIALVEWWFTKPTATAAEDNQFGIWLDDVRPMPEGYDIHVLTAKEAIQWLQTKRVTHISLDHDLGDAPDVGNGYDVAKFIEEAAFNDSLPRLKWKIHSANPVGITNMNAALKNANRYWDNNDAAHAYQLDCEGEKK